MRLPGARRAAPRVAGGIDRGRRAFLRGRARTPQGLRPPWASPHFLDACSRCGACIDACPERILFTGDGSYPEVRFDRGGGECTFCGACAKACPEGALDAGLRSPWRQRARIARGCLALDRVHCQSCADACGAGAVLFALVAGGPPAPHVDANACTGCGACEQACPVGAIRVCADDARTHDAATADG